MVEKVRVTVIDFDKERRKQEFKEKLDAKIQDGKDWFIRNKECIVTLTPIVAGSLVAVVKVVGKRANLRKQESIKNLYCYDRSLGHYWRLRRELSNREWVEVDRRKRNGERLADILSEMRVLKLFPS